MYVPTLNSILRAIGTDRSTYERSPTVTLPKEMFKFLVRVALEHSDFNEGGYLRENPDVAEGIAKGTVEGGAKSHYVGYGYFEGRTGATPPVNERWYLATYTDVADGIKLGKIKSGAEHYNEVGGAEGRSPSPEYLPVAAQWKKALVKA